MHKICILIFITFLVTSCSTTDKNKKSPMEKKADLYYSHGTEKLVKREYTAALKFLLQAEKLKPRNAKVQNNLGMAYFFKGQENKAIEHLTKSIRFDPKNSDAKSNLASVLFKQGKMKQAKRLYLEVTKDLIYKHQYRVLYNLAMIHMKQNEIQETIKYLNRSINEKSDYCIAHFQLGEINRKKQFIKQALDNYKMASDGTCINLPEPQYQQALLLLQLGQPLKAQFILRRMEKSFKSSRYSQLASLKLKELNQKKINKFSWPNDKSPETKNNTIKAQNTRTYNSPTF